MRIKHPQQHDVSTTLYKDDMLNDTATERTLKIVVLSLTSSLTRRQQITDKFANLDVKFEFLNAIDGRTDTHPYLQNYHEHAFLKHRRRKAVPGELGCYVSHLLAWEKCIALNQPLLVLEDDAELTPDFMAGIKVLQTLADNVGYVRVEPLESKWVVTVWQQQHFSLVKQLKVGMCATGYLITPNAAKQLLKKATAICYPIDLFLKYTFIHQQTMYALCPPLVYPTHSDSIIGIEARKQRERGLGLQLQRFVYKWFYVIDNTTTNLVNCYKK
jgi:glycosyl transferase family 25